MCVCFFLLSFRLASCWRRRGRGRREDSFVFREQNERRTRIKESEVRPLVFHFWCYQTILQRPKALTNCLACLLRTSPPRLDTILSHFFFFGRNPSRLDISSWLLGSVVGCRSQLGLDVLIFLPRLKVSGWLFRLGRGISQPAVWATWLNAGSVVIIFAAGEWEEQLK